MVKNLRSISGIRIKPQPRDAVQGVDYNSMLTFLDKEFVAKINIKFKIKLALFFLYNFGMRVDETRLITKNQLRELYTDGFTVVLEPKTNRSRTVALLTISDSRLLEFNEFFNYDGFIMRSRGKKIYSIAAYNRLINNFLKEYSRYIKTDKILRSHSFRIGFVTDLLSGHSPEEVRQLIGHSDISTTLRYSRYKISLEKIREMLQSRK